MKIMILEDDVKLREELAAFLGRYGYDVSAPTAFNEPVDRILEEDPQLLLLDINLPAFDGFTICKELRRHSSLPVIIVTSRDSEVDELMAMQLGADDFVSKPFNTQILLARIESVLKRTYHSQGKCLYCNGVTLDISRGYVKTDHGEAELTKNEQRILHLLMKHSGEIVSRETLMNELWQSDVFVDDNTLTVNINRLRKKLEDLGKRDFIVTKRGQGYRV